MELHGKHRQPVPALEGGDEVLAVARAIHRERLQRARESGLGFKGFRVYPSVRQQNAIEGWRENSSTDLRYATVEGTPHSYAMLRVEGLRDAIAMPTFGSPHADAIRMWTSVGSETTERRLTEDCNHPIILIGRLIMIGATFDSNLR